MILQGQRSLIDSIAAEMHCQYISDLRYLDLVQRRDIAEKLRNISVEEVPLIDWNDALRYLVDARPEQTVKEAKEQLIYLLVHKKSAKDRKDTETDGK